MHYRDTFDWKNKIIKYFFVDNLQFIIRKGALERITTLSHDTFITNTKFRMIIRNHKDADAKDFLEIHIRKYQKVFLHGLLC